MEPSCTAAFGLSIVGDWLVNPDWVDHWLMQSSHAVITCRPCEVTERDERLGRYLTAIRLREPQILPPGL